MITEYFLHKSISLEFARFIDRGLTPTSFKNIWLAVWPFLIQAENGQFVQPVNSDPKSTDKDYYIYYSDEEMDEMIANNNVAEVLKITQPEENPQLSKMEGIFDVNLTRDCIGDTIATLHSGLVRLIEIVLEILSQPYAVVLEDHCVRLR
jgi:hypothetical protein